MSIGLIIFARLDSRRLPGKALREIAGRALLGHVLDRARRVPGGYPIVVATSTRALDDPIEGFAREEGAEVFRGATEDVAGRALACAEDHGFERFARITGDSPFFDPDLANRLVALSVDKNLDLATNVFPRSFPVGASVEVIATAALRRMVAATSLPDEREHLTRHFYRHPGRFRIENVSAGDSRNQGVRLAVDTEEDLARSEWMMGQAEMPASALPFEDLVALARAWQAREYGNPDRRVAGHPFPHNTA